MWLKQLVIQGSSLSPVSPQRLLIASLTTNRHYVQRDIWFLSPVIKFLSPSGDLGIGLVWHNLSPPHPTPPDHISVWQLKSSSNWTKSSMMGPQLFSGWYQMILGVFRCSQLFSDVFRLFSNCFPTMFSDCWNPLQAELNYLWWVLSCSQDDIRWF